MTVNPYRSGDFVWSNFPERENPARPGPPHIGYVAVNTTSAHVGIVLLAYTTSQPWPGSKPAGVYSFDRATAASMGQARAFTLDVRRMALVPVTVEWFPDLEAPNCGIVGRAPERIRVKLEEAMKMLVNRHSANIERLGPLWPRERR